MERERERERERGNTGVYADDCTQLQLSDREEEWGGGGAERKKGRKTEERQWKLMHEHEKYLSLIGIVFKLYSPLISFLSKKSTS